MAPESVPVYGVYEEEEIKMPSGSVFLCSLKKCVSYVASSNEMGKHFFLLCHELFLPGVSGV